ncbi:hypothetical protein GIB67_042311 [Kingdonia uniflora]|uniref:KANL3/Tex30 alpha/beta hydrolase-like domain-containing protein n=1 Tax=Kingdonia uniflora TaxID=39325 RepID=A0A7J7LE97_9MAGN|nr:hypothetical protein GIB67_042311 [Kingdonia uniflora]
MASSSPPSSKRRRRTLTLEDSPIVSSGKESSPLVVFAHGAGAPSTSDWMIRWKDILGKALHAVEVVTFDYPYISHGKRRAPPKAEKLIEYHKDIIKEAIAKHPGHPLILAGKSMGSRVSCMVACQEGVKASVVVCLGYPLKGMKGALRDETLLELSVPTMFVQVILTQVQLSMKGSKDGLCPLVKLKTVCQKMKTINELHVVDGGDHSLKIGKKHLNERGLTQDEAEDQAANAVAKFVEKSLAGS